MPIRHGQFVIAALVLAACCAIYLALFDSLDAMNAHISRCSDESAPQYIQDREQRRRECGR